ncbi:MAG TPA: hypothetical protein VJV79_33220, partial [Polyangiaceae bacterium]|nr:hypothetical protein [Polyangiaceae bacterium]
MKQVLADHDAFAHPRALDSVLGDGYLYRQNFLFRNVRDLALASGFRFSDSAPPPHAQRPLPCPETIWEQRLIPVLPNVPALRSVEERAPGALSFFEIADRGLETSAPFHDAVRCLARSVVRAYRSEPQQPVATQKQRVLERSFEESCANAAEVLCASFADTEMQRVFAQLHLPHVPLQRS